MSWKLVASSVPTEIGLYRIESERDGDQTAHLITFPDGRQIRVLPDGDHSGQYRIRVVKAALVVLLDVAARSESLPAEYDPMVYLYGALCSHNLEWEQVWNRQTIEDWLETYFVISARGDAQGPESALSFIRGLEKAGWVIQREDQ